MKFVINDSLYEKAESVAKQRFANNRKANNPAIKMHNTEIPYFSDLIGALAEIVVAEVFEYEWEGRLFDQSQFRKVKNDIHDVKNVEVKSSHHPYPHLVLHQKDLELRAYIPFVLVSIDLPKKIATIHGWLTPQTGCVPEFWDSKKGHYKAAYFIPSKKLEDIISLKNLFVLFDSM